MVTGALLLCLGIFFDIQLWLAGLDRKLDCAGERGSDLRRSADMASLDRCARRSLDHLSWSSREVRGASSRLECASLSDTSRHAVVGHAPDL